MFKIVASMLRVIKLTLHYSGHIISKPIKTKLMLRFLFYKPKNFVAYMPFR